VGNAFSGSAGIVRPVDLTDRVLALVPQVFRRHLLKRREEVKFAVVGGFCYLVTTTVYYALKLTVLSAKTVTALAIATVIASIISYLLNRGWSFRTRGGRRRHHEAALFFLFSGIAVALTVAPQYVSRYVLDLRTPFASRPVQEVADFVSGLIVGTLLGMIFRLWAFRRWVFPSPNVRPGRGDRRPVGLELAGTTVPPIGVNGHVNGHAFGDPVVTGTLPVVPAQEISGSPSS
jgi:putative flippase GtrA